MKKNIIIFSAIDWDTQWQWQQELAIFLSQKYNVLFIENTGVRKLKIKDTKRVYLRIKNIIKNVFGFRKIKNNLYILSPFFLPFPYGKTITKINFFLIFNKLQKWIVFNNFKIHSVFTFSATPVVVKIIKNLNPNQINFLYTDLMSKSSNDAILLRKYEKEIIKYSDNVFYSSLSLKKNIANLNKNNFFFPGGVDLKKFSKVICYDKKLKSQLDKFKKPIIGFLGQIKNVIDIRLIEKIARKFNDCTILMVGPVDRDMLHLKETSLENLIFLGPQDHKNVPYILSKFKVGIIPYIKNSFTDAINPAKLNEYIASNLSVVTTNLNEVINYNKTNKDIILISNNHKSFLNNLSNVLKNKRKNNFKKIIKKYDWQQIFQNLSQQTKLQNYDNENKFKNDNQLDKKINFFNKFFYYSLRRSLVSISLIIFIIFFSGIPSFFSNYLKYFDKIENQAINGFLVMTGHGNENYYNENYLERLEEVKFYKKIYNPKKILILGRWSYKQEDKVIKGLLISEGYNKDEIEISSSYFANTKENILFSKNFFDTNSIDGNILVITDPYHSKRTKLISEKMLKNKNNFIIAKGLNNEKYKKFKFMHSISEIKVIFYEHLSIIYNKIRSWA
jgi:uncharacterized SAM-binding protein YcdF (DUF218 family)